MVVVPALVVRVEVDCGGGCDVVCPLPPPLLLSLLLMNVSAACPYTEP